MASTVKNGIDRLQKGNERRRRQLRFFPEIRFVCFARNLKTVMLIYYTHNFWMFFGSCDQPMPGPFPALPIFLGKKPWERGCELGFQYQSAPDPVSATDPQERENYRLLGHMRHIPFIHKLWSHPTLKSISTYIQNCYSYFFFMVFASCLGTLLICCLRMRSSSPRISRFSTIFKSFCPISGAHWNEIRRNTVSKTTQLHHAIWRWLSQRANFASLRKAETGVEHTHDCPKPPSI